MRVIAQRVMTAGPSDVSGIGALFDTGVIHPHEVVAVLGKTEGNGGRNDFTRELAVTSVLRLLAERTGQSASALEERVVLSFSGGTEGVASPHVVVLGVRGEVSGEAAVQRGEAVEHGAAALQRGEVSGEAAAPRGPKRLALGVGFTRAFAPEEIGRRAQVLETARAVREIAASLALDDLSDVHLVQMKGAIPGASFDEAQAARRRGVPLRNDMVYSRGASALGAGVAVGEVDERLVTDQAIGERWDLCSGVASVSAKPGLVRTEIMVLAMSPRWQGELVIGHRVMRDILDVDAVRDCLHDVGISFAWRPSPEQVERVVGVFAKSEADPRRTIRGRRHVMLDDDDVSDTRYSRCVLSAVLASVVGESAVYVSTRAEHHGPLGGGPVAIVARAE